MLWLFLLPAIFICVACTRAPEILRINHFNQITDSSTDFAEEKGYFRDTGVILEKVLTQKGEDAITALLNDDIDLAMVSSYVFVNALMNPDLKNHDELRLLSAYLSTYHGMSILANSDLKIDTPSDFRGVTIGVTRGTQYEYYLDSLFAFYDLYDQNIRIQNETNQEHLESLRNGTADIVITSEPYRTKLLSSPEVDVRVIEADRFLRLNMIFITTGNALSTKRSAIVAFLKAIDLVSNDFREKSEKTIDLLSRVAGIDRRQSLIILNETDFDLKLDSLLVLTMIKQSEWNLQRNSGCHYDIPDFSAILEPGVLEEVSPEYVDLKL